MCYSRSSIRLYIKYFLVCKESLTNEEMYLIFDNFIHLPQINNLSVELNSFTFKSFFNNIDKLSKLSTISIDSIINIYLVSQLNEKDLIEFSNYIKKDINSVKNVRIIRIIILI